MEFEVGENEEVMPRKKVKLTLDASRNGVMYLKADGQTIMGFSRGQYCLYSDAIGHAVSEGGLDLDIKGFIRKFEGTF
jgi:hypothetical protein